MGMKTSRLITLVKESLADDPIEFVDASTDWQSPFRLARRCKGVALQHSVALDALDPMLFEGLVMELAEDYVPGPEVALEAFFEAWHICTPEGSDPLAEAASISRITMLPGRWPTPEYHKDASRIYTIGARLYEQLQGDFFLPCHKVAKLLGMSPKRVSRLLTVLTAKGYFAKSGKYTTTLAQRYVLGDVQVSQRLEGDS